MKRIALFLLLLFIIPSLVISQENFKRNAFYFKTILNQPNIGYERFLTPAISLSFEAGYRINWIDSWFYKGTPLAIEYIQYPFAFHGFSFRTTPNFRVSKRFTVSPMFGYQSLSAQNMIYDPGDYAGEWESPYKVYNQISNEILLAEVNYIDIGRGPVQFYFGVGVKLMHVEKDYSIDGTTRNMLKSDKKEISWTGGFSIYLGFKITFVKF